MPPPPPPPGPPPPPTPPPPPPPAAAKSPKAQGSLLDQLAQKKSTMKSAEAVEAALWDDEYSQGRQEHVGLSNQGATCYLNSLLQALFMLPEFRSAVWACEGGESEAGGSAEMSDEELAAAVALRADSIPRQLQLLFARLQLGVRRAVGTQNVTRSFGWGNEEAFQQHDVLELFTVLLDALSSAVGVAGGGAPSPASLFAFEMSDALSYALPSGETIRRARTVPEKYLSLPLSESTGSLEVALQRYVEAEIIEGFQADEAGGARVTATKALAFATLPPLLMLNLGRFDVNSNAFFDLSCCPSR